MNYYLHKISFIVTSVLVSSIAIAQVVVEEDLGFVENKNAITISSDVLKEQKALQDNWKKNLPIWQEQVKNNIGFKFSEEVEPFKLSFRVLNKRTDETTDYNNVSRNELVTHQGLIFSAKNCSKNLGNQIGNDAGYLEIQDSYGSEVFNGWMYKNFPGVSGLEHATYDVRILNCTKI